MMEIVTKDFPVVAGEATDEYPHGTFEVILSSPTLDRDGEIVDSKAFEPLPDHITFDTDHSMTCDSVVGSGVPSYNEQGLLVVKGGYSSDERSQIIRKKVAEKHIRTTSVTFMSAEREPDSKGVPHVVKAELLNGTFTPVPSNRESVVLTAKSILEHEEAAAEKAQADESAKTTIPENAKAIVGSLEAQRQRVADALSDAYPLRYCYIRGVLPTSVVFDVWGEDDSDTTYQQDYTDDGSVVTLTGEPVEVDVMEIVTPDADAITEPAAKAAEPAAADEKAAADSTADAADEGSADLVRWDEIKSAATQVFAD